MTVPRRNDLLILIPAWNEEQTIGTVIEECRSCCDDADVLVVSDGSTDATAEIAYHHGAKVLELPFNLGVGGAMRAGYKYALRNNYSQAVQLDADGQHDPSQIGLLQEAMSQTGSDIVIGARFAGDGDYTVHGPRKWAMSCLSFILSRVVHTKLTDTTSGFKLSNRSAITLFAADYPSEYLGDTIEALVIAARTGLKIAQTPVTMRARAGGEASHGPLKSTIFLARAFFAMMIALSRPAKKLAEKE